MHRVLNSHIEFPPQIASIDKRWSAGDTGDIAVSHALHIAQVYISTRIHVENPERQKSRGHQPQNLNNSSQDPLLCTM
jgi:hypothetical protein